MFTEDVKMHQLPDGRVIKVGTERFQAPEALFTPVSLGIFRFNFLFTGIWFLLCFSFYPDTFTTHIHALLHAMLVDFNMKM